MTQLRSIHNKTRCSYTAAGTLEEPGLPVKASTPPGTPHLRILVHPARLLCPPRRRVQLAKLRGGVDLQPLPGYKD